MDVQAITKLLDYGLLGLLLFIALYAIIALYKKINEVQESRVKDSVQRENTVTVALEAVTHSLDQFKSILITLEKQHGQSKTENKD